MTLIIGMTLLKSLKMKHLLSGLIAFVVGMAAACITGRPVVVSAAEDLSVQNARRIENLEIFLAENCYHCHNEFQRSGGLNLESIPVFHPADAGDQEPAESFETVGTWENVVRRLQTRQMPPAGEMKPAEADYDAAVDDLAALLDQNAERDPVIGRVPTIRRLTRTQYRRVVGDLFGIDIDVTRWLPADSVSDGFDNITLEDLSPLLMNRYLRAAADISRSVVGRPDSASTGLTIRVPPDRTQSRHVEGLPLGSRGGVWFEHLFPVEGRYRFRMRLTRDRDERVEGLDGEHHLDLLIDDMPVRRFRIEPPEDPRDQASVDRHLKLDLWLPSGIHKVGITFASRGSPLMEIKRKPFDARFNRHRHPRRQPALYEVSIFGPLDPKEDRPNRSGVLAEIAKEEPEGIFPRRIWRELPSEVDDDRQAVLDHGRQVIADFLPFAYRRATTWQDERIPFDFFQTEFATSLDKVGASGDESTGLGRDQLQAAYQVGMESALASILVNPNFLFRVEAAWQNTEKSDAIQSLDPYTLASRLSFFLLNSCPDEQLLRLAESGELMRDEVLRRQADRLLRDPRSIALTEDFATQWLYLRNLETLSPDLRRFPDFDDNLRQAFAEETKALFSWVVRNDRPVTDFIQPGRMFLNQRLAMHYGIPGVLGEHIREVALSREDEDADRGLPDFKRRGGLLRNGSILMITSYATRTSPTVRGSWILENLFGTPPPPPPPNVPDLKEKTAAAPSSVRERLAQHRADPSCAACHDLIDPLGFALEHYDALGRFRWRDGDMPVDATGRSPSGRTLQSVKDLEKVLVDRPEVFAGVLTTKLMTFALGRGIEAHDAPAIRQIVKQAASEDFRFSALVRGIVASQPFRYRQTPNHDHQASAVRNTAELNTAKQ